MEEGRVCQAGITATVYVQSSHSTGQMVLWLWETNHPVSNHLFKIGTILLLKTKQVSKPIPILAFLEGPLSWYSFELKKEKGIVGLLDPFCTAFLGMFFSVREYMCVYTYIETVLRFIMLLFLQSLIFIKVRSGLWPISKSTIIITLCLMTQTCFNRPSTT